MVAAACLDAGRLAGAYWPCDSPHKTLLSRRPAQFPLSVVAKMRNMDSFAPRPLCNGPPCPLCRMPAQASLAIGSNPPSHQHPASILLVDRFYQLVLATTSPCPLRQANRSTELPCVSNSLLSRACPSPSKGCDKGKPLLIDMVTLLRRGKASHQPGNLAVLPRAWFCVYYSGLHPSHFSPCVLATP